MAAPPEPQAVVSPAAQTNVDVTKEIYAHEERLDVTSEPEKSSSVMHVEGNALLVDKHGKVRQLPIPSNDPNDPLNFSAWEKGAIIFCCCWFSLLALTLPGGLGPFLGEFAAMYVPQGYDANQIAFLLTIPSLCIGLGNYVVLPLSLAIGRRPVFLLSIIILVASTISAALQDSYTGHIISRVFQGLATGASESLLPLMLTEVTFLHQRGKVFGLYWMCQSIFSAVLNIASSYINASLGWRWYYWIFVITVGAGLLFAILGAFETRFSRPVTSIDGIVVYTDDFGVTHVIPDDEAQDFLDQRPDIQVQTENDVAAADVPSKAPYLRRIMPWSKPHPEPLKIIVTSWWLMLRCLTSPAIVYAILISSISLAIIVDMSLTYDAVLEAYGWQPASIGLLNIGSIIGALIGTAYSVFIGDPFVLWMARRNKGVHKPEHRLIVLIPGAIIGFSMIILYGFTATGASTWWGTVLAYTFYSSTWVCVLIVSTTFAAEVSPKHPGPTLVMVVGTKNLVSFGATYSLTPMMERGGYTWAFGVLSGVFAACFLLGFPVYFLNSKWREATSRMERKREHNTTD